MKPFFSNTMLVTLTFEEACDLRAAISHYRKAISIKGKDGNELYQKELDRFNQLYEDLTKITEILPF